jgi:hypothetical protein
MDATGFIGYFNRSIRILEFKSGTTAYLHIIIPSNFTLTIVNFALPIMGIKSLLV